MVKCLNGGPCVWKDEISFCNAPCPGKMDRSCNGLFYTDLPENHKLALLLEGSPGLAVDDCSFESFLVEADWLIARGVRVEDV